MTDGDSIELVAGPQGGLHLDVSANFGGFGPSGVELVYEAVDMNAQIVGFVTQAFLYETNVLEAGDGAWVRVGDRVVMDTFIPEELVGQELILRVTAGLDGQTWSDERRVVVVDEE